MLGGPGIVVEVDEALFRKRQSNKGRVVPGKWIFGGIEPADKTKTFFEVVERRDFDTLSEEILKNIAPGSIIHSDGWASYRGID